MTVKTPIRTVFDAQNNATGLAEFQSGERIGISHAAAQVCVRSVLLVKF